MLKFLFFLVTYFINEHVSQTNMKDLKLENAYNGSLSDNQIEYFKLTIDSNKDNFDLLISVRPSEDLRDFSDPDIFISKKIQYPSQKESEWKSSNYGEDIISICPNDATTGSIFYIAIKCETKCKFELISRLESEYVLTPNEEISLNLKKDEKKLFKYNAISSDMEFINIFSYSESFSKYKIFVAMDSSPNFNNHLEVSPFFIGGYVVNLPNNQVKNSNKCEINILIIAEDESDITLSLRMDKEVSSFRMNQPKYGIVHKDKRYCYILKSSYIYTNDTLILITNLYSGLANLYINKGFIPNETSAFQLKSNIDENMSTKINTTFLLDTKTNKFSDLFICLYANFSASYSLIAYFESETTKIQKYNRLISGVPSYGILSQSGVTSYKLLDYGIGTNNTVSLSSHSGTPILSLYYCKEKSCIFDSNMLEKNKPSLIPASKINDKQMILIDTIDNECHKKAINSTGIIDCYLLAVVTCVGNNECDYELININKQNEILLSENVLFSHLVGKNMTDYYKIIIPTKNDINKITIILSSINGETDLFTSKTFSKPDEQNYDKASMYKSFRPDIVTYNKNYENNLGGVYYIGVTGNSLAYYSLIYYTTYNDKAVFNPVYLSNGLLLNDYLNTTMNEFNYKLFAFTTVNLTADHESEGIIISLSPESTDYMLMYVYKNLSNVQYDDFSGLMTNYDYKSIENEIKIKKADAKTTYFIFVVLNSERYIPDKNQNLLSFYICSVLQGDNIILNQKVSSIMTLDQNHGSQGYSYYLHEVKEDINININLFYGKLTLYADLNPINSSFVAKFYKTYNEMGKLVIPSTYLKSCKIDKCLIYIYLKKEEDCQYIINISSDLHKPEPILKGIPLTRSILPNEYHYFTSYLFERDNNTIINLFNIYGFTSLFAKIYRQDESLVDIDNMTLPTKKDSSYEAKENIGGMSIQLTINDINCAPCLLIIGVYGENNFYDHESKYTLNYIGNTSKIMLNQLYNSRISNKSFEYFMFNFPSSVETLYVTLSNMDGDADLYLSFGGYFPTLQNYDWKSASTFNEMIDIDIKDNYFSNKGISSMSGVYIVGVYGYSSSSYSILVSNHKKKIQVIDNEHSANGLTRTEKDYVYFIYKNMYHKIEPDDFSLLFSTNYVYGAGKIYANLVKSNITDIYEQTPNKIDYQWSSENNFLNINLNRTFLEDKGYQDKSHTEISMLIGVFCHEKCYFTLHGTSQSFLNEKQIHLGIPKLVYVEKNKNLNLKYNYDIKDKLSYSTTVLQGEANFKLMEVKDQNMMVISQYDSNILQNSKNIRLYSLLNYKENEGSSYVVEVLANSNTAFMMKISREEKVTKFVIDNSNNVNKLIFSTEKMAYNGYFEVLNTIDYINLHLTPSTYNKNLKSLKIYIKLKMVQKSFIDSPYSDFPTENDHDYADTMNLLINRMTMRLPGVKIPLNSDLLPIYLITIDLNINNFNKVEQFHVDFMINPEIKDVQRYKITPFVGLLARILVNNKYHLFELEKSDNFDSNVVLSISECRGKINYKVTNSPNFDGEIQSLSKAFHLENGMYTSTFKSNSKMHYLTVLAKEGVDENMCINNDKSQKICIKEQVAEFLLLYKTYRDDELVTYYVGNQGIISWENSGYKKILLKWDPVYVQRNNDDLINNGKQKVTKNKFIVYLSNNQEEFIYMQSVCYLSLNSHLIISELYDQYQVEIKIPLGSKIYVSILSIFEGNHLSYAPIEIDVGILNYFTNPYVILPTIGVVVFLILIAVYFWKKYRMTKKKLDSEVKELTVVVADQENSNLPNASQLAFSAGSGNERNNVVENKLKYGSLKEEN